MASREFTAAEDRRTDAQALAVRAGAGVPRVEASERPVVRHRGREACASDAGRTVGQATRSAILVSGLLQASGLVFFRRSWAGR